MVLCCAPDLGRAKELGRVVRGQAAFAVNIDDAIRLTGLLRPSVVLLDARLGRSERRALEWLPWFQQASPLSALVILSYSPSPEEIQEMAVAGAYCFIDLDRPDASSQIREAVQAAPSRRRVALPRRGRRARMH